VIGKANLKAYFQRGLEAYPELHFRLMTYSGCKQRCALLHKSKRDAHGGIHGVLGEWKSCTSCRKLQCSEVVILHIRES